jgi:hypothetical protein
MRTTAIALGGRPEERAKMVCSRGCIAYLVPSYLKRQRNFGFPGGRAPTSWASSAQQMLQQLEALMPENLVFFRNHNCINCFNMLRDGDES